MRRLQHVFTLNTLTLRRAEHLSAPLHSIHQEFQLTLAPPDQHHKHQLCVAKWVTKDLLNSLHHMLSAAYLLTSYVLKIQNHEKNRGHKNKTIVSL